MGFRFGGGAGVYEAMMTSRVFFQVFNFFLISILCLEKVRCFVIYLTYLDLVLFLHDFGVLGM